MKKRTCAVGAAAAAIALIVAGCGQASSEEGGGNIVAANFGGVVGEVMGSCLEAPYSEESAVNFEQIGVPSGFTAKLQAQADSNNIQWDVVSGMSSIDAQVLAEEGVLAQLPEDMKAAAEEGAIDGSVTDFGVSLGDTGIVVVANKETLDKVPTSVDDFWNVEEFPGKRAVMDNAVQVMGMALLADSVAPDDVFPMDIDRSIESLEKIKPNIDVWTTSGDQQMQSLRSGQADMAIMWNGRAMALADEGMDLEVSWDGSLVNPNYMVAVEGSPNQDAALEYLKWYSQSLDGQTCIAEELAYGTSLEAVADNVSAEDQQYLPAANDDRQARVDAEWYVDSADDIQTKWREFLNS